MPRVNYVKKARKDNPCCKKGESYYWWKFRFGGKRYSKTPPKRSQLTQSDFYSQLWELEEQRNDLCGNADVDSLEGFKSDIEDIAQQLEDLGSECEDKRDSMPEQLQDGDVGQLLETRSERCQEMASELEDALSEIEDIDLEEEITVICPNEKCEEEITLQPDFAGKFKCSECKKNFDATALVEQAVQERREQAEQDFMDAVSQVEDCDMDCE
jgi:flagellar biosynthesis chaperone FliJ